jgi:Tfp pilus assembly PilM family ATPase
MDNKINKILEFVSKQEDFFYNKLGDDQIKNVILTAQAASFQKVRYFIEDLMESENDGC